MTFELRDPTKSRPGEIVCRKDQHRTRAHRHEMLLPAQQEQSSDGEVILTRSDDCGGDFGNRRDRPFAGLTQFFELRSFVPC